MVPIFIALCLGQSAGARHVTGMAPLTGVVPSHPVALGSIRRVIFALARINQ